MSRSLRRSFSWVVAALLCAGCTGNAVTVPPPLTSSPSPPVALGSGTLAVINRDNPAAQRVWIFPPHSDNFTKELVFPGARYVPNSLAFDRRGHLYIGYNDTAGDGAYEVVEANVRNLDIVRTIRGLPRWDRSSVAVDSADYLYVNTKSLVGGDIKIYRPNLETNPAIEIKSILRPLVTLVSGDDLWVGYEGLGVHSLTRYHVRSSNQTASLKIGTDEPVALAVNTGGTLIAPLLKSSGARVVNVYDVKSGQFARQIFRGPNLEAFVGDRSGNLYLAQRGVGTDGHIFFCTFRDCPHSIESLARRPFELAVSPLDGRLYVSTDGKRSIEVYHPRTGNRVQRIALHDFAPGPLALEP